MSQLNLEGVTDYRPSYRVRVVQSLVDSRREWQIMVQGKNFVEVEASIGLILADITERLELNSQERHVILGGRLINQVNCLKEECVSTKLPP